MTRTSLLCASLAALAILGCGRPAAVPTSASSPDPAAQTLQPPPALGIYHLTGNAETLNLDLVARSSQALADTYSVDITSIAGPNLRLSSIELLGSNSVRATFRFTHPLPDTSGRKDLHVFDVRLHVLGRDVGTTFSGPGGMTAPVGTAGSPAEVAMADTGVTNEHGWSTWGDEVVEPALETLAPNLFPYFLLKEDIGRGPLNPDSPAGWNVIPQGTTAYNVQVDFQLTPSEEVDLFLGLDASYGNSSLGQVQIPKPDPGGRLNPRFFNPEFNLKEAWKTTVFTLGSVIAGSAASSANISIDVMDHQGALPAVGAFDPLTAPSTSLRYASDLKEVVISIPGPLANAITIPGDSFTGDGTPGNPYHRNYLLTGDLVGGPAGTYAGLVAVRDEMMDSASATSPLPTTGYTRDAGLVGRFDFTTYQTFTLDVTVSVNQPPTAEVLANPTVVPNGSTTELSPGPGTSDPDGSIALYEYDFNYDGTFTADASNATGAPVTSPSLTVPGTISMAMRVTDNGGPALSAIDTVDVTIEAPGNLPPFAEVVANPEVVDADGTVDLSSGPGTLDPDGSIILYEFDFDHQGVFTVDASNLTGAAETSPPLANPGATPIFREMAMRVTDNGAPALSTVDTIIITINGTPGPPTWTQIHSMIRAGDPNTAGDEACISCHEFHKIVVMNSDKNVTYANLVNVASTCGMDYIEPNDPANSFLFRKINPSPACGDRMPQSGPPYWSATAIQMVSDWINDGAQNN